MSDGVWEILTDPNYNVIMGLTAENLAEKYNISREEQDEIAFRSHKKMHPGPLKKVFLIVK